MAKRIYTTEPRRVYVSPEGRAEVWRNGPGDFTGYVDGEPVAFTASQDAAEVAVGVALHELAEVA